MEVIIDVNDQEFTITLPKVSKGITYVSALRFSGMCKACDWFPFTRTKKVAKCIAETLNTITDALNKAMKTLQKRKKVK